MKDPAISLCTPATRGVWIDLLCAMHELGRSGELRGTTDQIARVARCSTAELAQALTDLQTTGAADVTERNGVVTVINRRMKREAQERLATNQRVQRHRCNGSVTRLKRESSTSSSSSPSVTKTSPSRAREEIPAIGNPTGEIEDPELEALASAVQQVTGVKSASWQLADQIRSAAIELRGQGFSPDEVVAIAQQKGKSYRLKFVAQDLATDRQQLAQQRNGNANNRKLSSGAAALIDYLES